MSSFIPGYADVESRFNKVEVVYFGKSRSDGLVPHGPEIVLTADEFRNTFSTPKVIIPASPTKMIIPSRIHIRKESGGAFVAGANTGVSFRLANGFQGNIDLTLATLQFDQVGEITRWYFGCTNNSGVRTNFDITANINSELRLIGLTANMTSGGAPVHISILAELWPISLD